MSASSPYELANLLVNGGVAIILIAVAFIDWQTRRIPNVLVLGLIALRLVMLGIGLFTEGVYALHLFGRSILVSLAFTTGVLVARALAGRFTHTDALGLGDVKLIAACCLFLSFDQALAALFVASFAALILAAYFRICRQDNTFPFGPALSLGFLITL
ncbi:prepilin peptidase [Anaerotardibacter muris]|uniref:prepilin peptidase n=1 Tax=Anaerotardibacter muris TaxID=2941505 RepID=UPI00204100E0|nr:A24 family peptidase [Anaerotardibacter muris]